MSRIFAVLTALFLASCAAPSAVIDEAVEQGLTVEDAQRAAAIFKATNNPAGERCMTYLAGRMLDIRAIRTDLGDKEPGPLTAFAIAHSTIETVQNRDLGAFGDACGALRLQVKENVAGVTGVVRKVLMGL